MTSTGCAIAECGCGASGLAVDWPMSALVEKYKNLRKGAGHMLQNISLSSNGLMKVALAAVPAISAEGALTLVGSAKHVFVDLCDGT